MKRQTILRWIVTIGFLIAAGFLFLFPLDYYVKKPGEAYPTADYIEVDDKDTGDKGEFRFTTVAIMKATPFFYLLANILPNQEVVKVDEVFQEDEDEGEYEVRQLQLMDSSKFSAISVAFKKAGLPVNVRYDGIYVLNILTGSAAYGVLQPGDAIVEVDGDVLENIEQLGEHIDKKNKGDSVEVVVKRGKELLTKTMSLKEIPNVKGKIGLGIRYTESKSLETTPHVDMDTEDIGGPSAGLMFTLEILNQLLDEDLTHGYVIAGTGTMNENGTVGRIGGIEKKVVAAHRAGATYFFAPDDEITAEMLEINPLLKTNYEQAVEAVKTLNTTMQVIPVKTVDDAIDFLNTLKTKS